MKLGPFNRTIPITTIKHIRKKKSLLASAALAFERLEICFGHYEQIHISPKYPKDFVKALQQLNPNITIK